jgi:TonB family protein
MTTTALIPERKISRLAVAISFAAQAVFVEVTFAAAGQVLVVRIARGLGYGLDEQAIRAAQQIRFKPAQLGGQPLDSRLVVHLIFN